MPGRPSSGARGRRARALSRRKRRALVRVLGVALMVSGLTVVVSRASTWASTTDVRGDGIDGDGESDDPTTTRDAAVWGGGCGVGGAAFGESTCAREREHPGLDVLATAVKPTCVNAVAIAALNQYVGPRRIVVVVPDETRCAAFREMATNVECRAEDEFLGGVERGRVEAALEELYPDELGDEGARSRFVGRELGGWYMQQLMKLGASTSKAISSPPLSRKFLIWDLDMIPLRPLDLFKKDDVGRAKAIRQIGGNVIKSYESSYETLTGEKMTYAKDGTSYVTHQMVVDADIVEEMLSVFARRATRMTGVFAEFPPWVTSILESANRKDLKLGFSEYASYASYVAAHHEDEVEVLPTKKWARASGGKLGIALQRWTHKYGLCCPRPGVLKMMKSRRLDYVGHEIGHVDSCRYNSPEHEFSYGLPLRN
ncbi:unnamed product [Ostreococcus tauri]|uniref:Unnamed product n=2 Tax=Ostreococcus tauri TaxID=70448 RepID=A0A090N2U3_OSTTA|nr:unnamed product [Ostreococcus tauri]CEF96838.1 unnamed product [Ostreococcus tauri]|eukprot:XP_003074574.2 unnamed product [Ostreococcus tauri]